MKPPEVKQEINLQNVIDQLGVKKQKVAEVAKLLPIEVSYVVRGTRKTKAYEKKRVAVIKALRILGAKI